MASDEINFRFSDALSTADDHVIYKTGAKEIAAQEGYSITFIVEVQRARGRLRHIHLSLADGDGRNVFGDDEYGFQGVRGGPARRRCGT